MTAPKGHGRPSSGFRVRPHTADVIVEAWGPTREACLAAAVDGLVATFADVSSVAATDEVRVASTRDGPDLLVELLQEVVFRLDVDGSVPVAADVRPRPDQVVAHLRVAPLDRVVVTGAAPKAVTYSGLALAPDDAGVWRARATVDV